MTTDKTAPQPDDSGLDELDRESFAWWILAQINDADLRNKDYAKRSDARIDCLSKIRQACYAIVQDTVIEPVEVPDDAIILSVSDHIEAKQNWDAAS